MRYHFLVTVTLLLRVLIYNGQAIAATVYVHPALVVYDQARPQKTSRMAPGVPAKAKAANTKIKAAQ